MFSEDNDTLGAVRLDDLQKRRVTGFQFDNVSMAFGPESVKTLHVELGDQSIGTWTRDGGLLLAHFAWQSHPCSTRSVNEAHSYTVEMVRQFRRRRAQRHVNANH
jgi:hypothetical protein